MMWFLPQIFVGLSIIFSFHLAHAATSSTRTVSWTASTSPFRTVNHITHSLAQQCLPSSRKVNITSAVTDPSGTPQVYSSATTTTTNETLSASSSVSQTSTKSSLLSSIEVASTPQEEETHKPSTIKQHPSPSSSGSEDDSPLDDGKFMSFEDWKRDNLRKAGQSENIGNEPGTAPREPRKRPTGLRDSLDSLGDDAEIDLDFSGFVSDGLDPPTHNKPRIDPGVRDTPEDIDLSRPPKAGVRSQDAGTTCKERFNYASFDCAANVLKWNPEAKSPSAVLGENKDSYMLNECTARNKFLILELCNDISIDTIVLSNFEFFSSTFRTFRVSVSDKYPVKTDKWKTLGTFEARNSREVQAFLVENPVIWARYLRIEFLTHYGNEFYCPVSLVRVHGTTMLEDYKRDLESLQMEDDDKEVQGEEDDAAEDGLVPKAVAEQLRMETISSQTISETFEQTSIAAKPSDSPGAIANATESPSTHAQEVASSTSPARPVFAFSESMVGSEALHECASEQKMSTLDASEYRSFVQNSPKDKPDLTTVVSVAKVVESCNSKAVEAPGADTAVISTKNPSNVATEPSSSGAVTEDKATDAAPSMSPTNSSKTSPAATQSSQPAPTMQESFFKSVQKRLQMLEANSSLSLQYIEDQSRALRDAFQKVEQRQLAKTTSFLEYLNTTMLNELREFRQQYDQLWQSTVIELEVQREQYQRDNLAINARLGVLADEIIFQKRVSFLQLILIVICLGLVLFSKGNLNSYLELPLVQSVLSRSPSSRFLNAASPDTPVQSSPVSRSNSTGAIRKRTGILKGHRRFPSEDSTENVVSPIDPYTPSTPVSYGDPSSDGEGLDDSNTLGDPECDPSLIERPSTSPPALPSVESPSCSDFEGDIGEDSIDAILNTTPTNVVGRQGPILIVEDATPPPKHLKWQLPED